MTTIVRTPVFRVLPREECDALLARNVVGRLAYAHAGNVGIEPIHYVCRGEWLFGRTSPGTKLETVTGTFYRVSPVAFEVDEVEGLFQWRSVVVHGSFHLLDPEGSPWQRHHREVAVDALRTLLPATFTDADPVPFRTVVFGIAVQEVTGREALAPA